MAVPLPVVAPYTVRVGARPPLEMVALLNLLARPTPARRATLERVRAALPGDLLADIEAVFGRWPQYRHGLELPLIVPLGAGVEEWLAAERVASDRDFWWHVVGRALRPEDVEVALAAPGRASELLEQRALLPCCDDWMYSAYEAMLRDPLGERRAFERLAARFWEEYFRKEERYLRPRWDGAAAALGEQRERMGDGEFIASLRQGRPLPENFPEGYETREVEVVPVWYHPGGGAGMVYGWGAVTLLYDAFHQAAFHQTLGIAPAQSNRESLARAFAALSDENRLQILRHVAQSPELNGSWLAHKLGISRPAVSRHMALLRQAGLVEERQEENRVLYSLRLDGVRELGTQLLAYLGVEL